MSEPAEEIARLRARLHEARGELFVIRGRAELILEGGDSPSGNREHAREVLGSAERIQSILEEIGRELAPPREG